MLAKNGFSRRLLWNAAFITALAIGSLGMLSSTVGVPKLLGGVCGLAMVGFCLVYLRALWRAQSTVNEPYTRLDRPVMFALIAAATLVGGVTFYFAFH
jgi:hypothetical protein